MTIYESTIEKVRKGATFSINFPKRSLKINGKYVIKDGEYKGSLVPSSWEEYDPISRIGYLYERYEHSIPSASSDKSKTYFRALPLKQLGEEDMLFGLPREEARFELEFYVLSSLIQNRLTWEMFENDCAYHGGVSNIWFWQQLSNPSLIILKEWIETPNCK